MKQTIRLSENNLHKMIKEAVSTILSELDWKTYANAARKRAEQGASDYDIHQLDQAANKDLFNKYKTGDSQLPYAPQIDTRKGERVYQRNDDGSYSDKYPHAGQTGRWPQLGYQRDFSDTYYTPIGDNTEDEPFQRTSYDNFPTHQERHKDMSSYFNGTSKYVKGKGWENGESNESIIRSIVKESIENIIRKKNNRK